MHEIKNFPSHFLRDTHTSKIGEHNYGPVYDLILPALVARKQGPLRVLEIGVSYLDYGSGHAFCQMPYIQQFVGIDLYPLKIPYPEPHLFLLGDAYSHEMLEKLKPLEKFDLIVDDGSHYNFPQIYFMTHYRQFLKPGGIMVCEDLYSDFRREVLMPSALAGVDMRRIDYFKTVVGTNPRGIHRNPIYSMLIYHNV